MKKIPVVVVGTIDIFFNLSSIFFNKLIFKMNIKEIKPPLAAWRSLAAPCVEKQGVRKEKKKEEKPFWDNADCHT